MRPGQSFTGTIVFAEGFGAIGSTGVRFNAADEDPVKVVLTEQLAFEGSSDLGVSGITVEGFVSPSAAIGASDWRVVTMDQTRRSPSLMPSKSLTSRRSISPSVARSTLAWRRALVCFAWCAVKLA